MLVARRTSSALIIVATALGIGATIAIFGLINAVLLKPLSGVGQPDSVISLQRILRADAYDNFSYPDYQDYRDHCQSLS